MKTTAHTPKSVPFTLPKAPPAARIMSVLERGPKATRSAGEYRVTHGIVWVPNASVLDEKGHLRLDVPDDMPRQIAAHPGDIVWLNEMDASRLWDAGLIESPNATPSKVGRGCTLPLRDKRDGHHQTLWSGFGSR